MNIDIFVCINDIDNDCDIIEYIFMLEMFLHIFD